MSISKEAVRSRPNLALIRSMVPKELLDHDRWVAWRYADRETRKAVSGDELQRRLRLPKPEQKLTKPFLNVNTGRYGHSNNPSDWFGFDHVCSKVHDSPRKYHGVGFVLTGSPYVGVDLDDCFVDGEITDETLMIVRSLNSYTEVSPSGKGLKIITRATIDAGNKSNKEKGIEVYTNQYFTLTGNVYDGYKKINHSQEAINDILKIVRPPEIILNPEVGKKTPQSKIIPQDTQGNDTSLDSLEYRKIVEKIKNSKNGALFERLYFKGHVPEGRSQSEADFILLRMLNFYTGGDKEAMENIFKQSRLYRKRDKHPRYLSSSIDKAVDTYYGDYYNPQETFKQAEEYVLEHLTPHLFQPTWKGTAGATDRDVYLNLLHQASLKGVVVEDGVRISISTRDLTMLAGTTRDGIRSSIRRLRRSNFITLLKEGKGNRSSTYLLPPLTQARAINPSLPPVNTNGPVLSQLTKFSRMRWGGNLGRLGKGCSWLLRLIVISGDRGMSVKELSEMTGTKTSNIYRSLRKLEGFVENKRVPVDVDGEIRIDALDDVFVASDDVDRTLELHLKKDRTLEMEARQEKRFEDQRRVQRERVEDWVEKKYKGST